MLSRLYMETRSSSSSVLVQWDHSKANVVKKMSVNFAYVAKNTAFLMCLADTPQRSIPAAA